ncbi:heme-binding protein [Novosphingobium sp. BL-8A]|uniref:GlcG/HbpS family heme-binding protein n=1 Tax=Novosphingobium sp. BL-8A TaxID=3127639 RepID=UPI003757796D
MPGDYFDIPQSAQLKVPLGPPPGPNPQEHHEPARPISGIGFKLAAIAAQAAEQSCARDGYAITVAVADASGNLKAALAADGTRDNGIYMAMHKTATVVAFKIPTLELRERIAKDPRLIEQVTPAMSLLPGGVPIIKDGRFLGAIATSGASAHEEEKCARDGIAAIFGQL